MRDLSGTNYPSECFGSGLLDKYKHISNKLYKYLINKHDPEVVNNFYHSIQKFRDNIKWQEWGGGGLWIKKGQPCTNSC